MNVDAEKSRAAINLMRTVMLGVRPDRSNVVLTMATYQHTLNTLAADYAGLLENAVQLLENVLQACGTCTTMLFVGSGLGHAEFALAELLKRIAKSNPKYATVAGFRAVITDGGIGLSAPEALPRFVLKKTAKEAVEEYGGEYTAVVCIAPDPESQMEAPWGIGEAAAAAGCPFVGVWMETPTSTFNQEELEAAVKKCALNCNEALAVQSYVIDDDNNPRSHMTRHDWKDLNDRYVRFHVGQEHPHVVPQWKSHRHMAWLSFTLRSPRVMAAHDAHPVPLPPLEGDRLNHLVQRYTLLVKP